MALSRGFGDDTHVEGSRGNKGPRVFWLPNGKDTTLVFLDDEPVEVVRHRYFIRGDKDANDMRQTCFGMDPRKFPKPCPRECLACNAAIKHSDVLDRRLMFYLTVIDERKYEGRDGKEYKDQKQFLELNKEQADLFRERKKANGRLVGARFRVYRGKDKQADRIGNDWQFLAFVDLARHFWYSPAVPRIMEAERRKDPTKCPATKDEHHKKVVFDLIRPFDYDNLIGVYRPEEAEAFISVVVTPQSGAASAPSGGNADAPPPPPPESMPNYAMPAGQAPAYPGAAPPPASAPPPPQGYQAPAPPPPVSDPAGATAPAGSAPAYTAPAYTAPPPPTPARSDGQMPWDGPPAPGMPGYVPPSAPAPSGPPPGAYQAPPPPPPQNPPPPQSYVAPPTQQPHGFAPPPMTQQPAGRPPVQASAPPPPQPVGATAPAGAPYDFSQGWSQQAPGHAPAPTGPPAARTMRDEAKDV